MATSKSMEKSTNFEKIYIKIIREIKKTDTRDEIGEEQKDLAKNLMSNYGEIHKIAEYQQSDFEKFEADFSQYLTVLDAEKSIANALSTSISKIFPGRLERIGSTADGLKINSVDEFDRLYILNESDEYTFRKTAQTSIYKISEEGQLISSRNIRAQFADVIDVHMDSDEDLDDLDVEHAGSNSPCYSGVRFNGPCVTVLLQMMSSEEGIESFKFSQDYTIAFEFRDSKIRKTIMENIQRKTKYKSLPDAETCLVPDPLSGNWVLSTAFVEAKLFESFPSNAPIKCAAKIAKILISKISEENLKHDMSRLAKDPQEEKDALALMSPFHMDQRREMRYAHTFLSHTHAKKINELPKFGISLNSTAVRHIILRKCMDEDEFKDAFKDESDDVLVGKLVRAAFKEVSEVTKRSVPNALLRGDSTIDIFSISPHSHLKVHLPTYLHILRHECSIIAEKLFMKAGIGYQPLESTKKRKHLQQRSQKIKKSRKETSRNPIKYDSITEALQAMDSTICEFTAIVEDMTKAGNNTLYIQMSDTMKATKVQAGLEWIKRVNIGRRYRFINLYRNTLNDGFHFEFKEDTKVCRLPNLERNIQVGNDVQNNELRSLEDALWCQKSTIRGKIIKISGLKHIYTFADLKSKYLYLRDKSNPTSITKLAIFNKELENQHLVEGNVIQITNVQKDVYKNLHLLKTTKDLSRITKVDDATFDGISSTLDDDLIDNDDLVDEEEVEFQVEGVDSACKIKNYNRNLSQSNDEDIVLNVFIRTADETQISRPLALSTLEKCGLKPHRPSCRRLSDDVIEDMFLGLMPLEGVGVITNEELKVKNIGTVLE